MPRSSFGPGIVIRAENFGVNPIEEPPPDDAFARRQDAIQFLNDAFSEADEAAAKALEVRRAAFLAGEGEPVFADAPRTLLAERRKQALKMAPEPASRDELIFPGGAVEQVRLICKESECVGPGFLHLGTERVLVTIAAVIEHDVMFIGNKNEKVGFIPRADRQIRMPLYSRTKETADFLIEAVPLGWLTGPENVPPVVRRPIKVPGFLRIEYERSTP